MNNYVLQQLISFTEEVTDNKDNEIDMADWNRKVVGFLNSALGPEEKFSVNFENQYDHRIFPMLLGHLQGIIAKNQNESKEIENNQNTTKTIPTRISSISINSKKIFLVHGRDNEAKETTARFIERLKLEPIILHEQANAGQTIIEKFETYSDDVAFAIVLLTPDDIGASKDSPNKLMDRARQNVILELGYFMGKLGRTRVCALYKGNVELPSDYQGIVYIEMDKAGAWKAKISQEFVEAHISIDLTGLLGT